MAGDRMGGVGGAVPPGFGSYTTGPSGPGRAGIAAVAVAALLIGGGAGVAVGRATVDPEVPQALVGEEDAASSVARLTDRIRELETALADAEAQLGETTVAEPETEAPTGPGTREDPLPLGTPSRVDDYVLTVTDVVWDAAALVEEENQFNDPPVEGNWFVLVTVSAAYDGEGEGIPSVDLRLESVSDSQRIYTTYGESTSCGVIPDALRNQPDLFAGGIATGNVCWSVPVNDLDNLVMLATRGFAGDPVYFALR